MEIVIVAYDYKLKLNNLESYTYATNQNINKI